MFNRVKELRKENGMTLQQLADAVGSSKSYIYEIENSRKNNPTIGFCYAIAACLGYELCHVFPDQNTYEEKVIVILNRTRAR